MPGIVLHEPATPGLGQPILHVLASTVHLPHAVKLNSLCRSAVPCAAAIVAALSLAACTSTTTSATAPSSSKCQVDASAAPLQFSAGGGSGQLTISAARDCTWSVTLPVDWVAVNGARAGNGDATLAFTVASNPVPAARSADLVVEDVRLGVTQAAAACTYRLNRTGDSIGAAGGMLGVDITTLTGCTWSTSSSSSWLSVSRATGQSSGTVTIGVEANTGAARTGSVTLGGVTFTVDQAAGVTTPPTTPPPTTPPPTNPPPTNPPPTEPPPTDPPPPPPPPAPVSLSGTVSGLSGSCPSVRFTVGGRDVVTDGSTDFARGDRCRDLSNRDTIRMSGLTQTTGAVLATDIEITRDER